MIADFKVVLDACVLANHSVCDLLLRSAETPRLFLPLWSEDILRETRNTHLNRLGWPDHLVELFQEKVQAAFPEAMVRGYEHLISCCLNDPKDRHVLACAVHSKAELIVTFNTKDFPEQSLNDWGIEVEHPQDFLVSLYSLARTVMLHKLEQISRKRNLSLEDYLIDVGRFLPAFSQCVLEDISSG